jgi:hypothetical protein
MPFASSSSVVCLALAALPGVVACQPASAPTNSGNYTSPSSGEPADPNSISTEQGGPAGGPAAPPPPPQSPSNGPTR